MKDAVVIERATSNDSAYVPDLPGCVATGGSRTEAPQQIREAVSFYLEGLREDGMSGPGVSGFRWGGGDVVIPTTEQARNNGFCRS
ncbi:MAG: type II toxin-antitoxin system HicB family antitoxin [Gammaproteobacteria bacterium]|nr:type II toxin-antitoxin system HicB family antitoxin [Gammaproteobacteria bacterium]